MDESWLTERFGAHRARLHAVALRMLGSRSEADDAVQEAWLRVSGANARDVENFGGWLTTIVARICLDMLRSRKSRGEVEFDASAHEELADDEQDLGPEQELVLAESVGPALMMVLDTLAPAERVAFVLHDSFGVAFEEIAAILGRSPTAARQLASRARRRVREGAGAPGVDRDRQREIVGAFLAASRQGDFDALLAVLAPDVVLRADALAVRAAARAGAGAPSLSDEVRGARAVAEAFKGRARGATTAVIDGAAGAVWAPGGRVRAAFVFTVQDRRISEIRILMEPARLSALDVELASE